MRPILRTSILLLASGAGVGFSPWMPGTLGTLVGLPVSLALNRLWLVNGQVAVAALASLIIVGIMVAHQAARIFGVKDPQVVVIDEIAGFALANFLSDTIAAVITAFFLFRFFDIAKVFPGKRLEALPGGAGIVLDDVLAGLYTLIVLRLLSWTGLL
jgi:phosphatidylglycerophosphatase A